MLPIHQRDGVRVLFVADSHLGYDLPVRPRVERRRRGADFLANYARALAPALAGEVDVVIHGGDVFDRPGAVASLAYQAFEPLTRVADRGIPVFLVPGNHERSSLPHLRFAQHPRIHVFDRPRTVVADIRGVRVALSGFPYERRDVRTRFPELLAATEWDRTPADVRLLCLHHCFEGATVGPANYTFTTAADVIKPGDVPAAFAGVLSGHIHRHQVLTRDRRGRPLAVPVLYPGSIERTSLAEIGEPKGYLVLALRAGPPAEALRWEFRPLPARPMIRHELAAEGLGPDELDGALQALFAAAPADAVLSIRVTGGLGLGHWERLAAARLRTLVPPTMNVELRPDLPFQRRERHRREPSRG